MMHIRQLRGWLVRLFGLFQRTRCEHEFAEELASHLAFHIEDNLRAGMSPEEARRVALVKLGGVTLTKERAREQGGLPMLETLLQDLRFGLRMLRKNPVFSLIAILTLALGIGVNTALFTVYDAFVLKPLPLQDPYSIVHIRGMNREGRYQPLFSYLDYLDYRDRSTSFTGLVARNKFVAPFGDGAAGATSASLLPANFVTGHIVSGNYFAVLGAEMALGRGFAPEEDRTPGTHPVVVLSHQWWQRHFNADPQIIGKTVRVAGAPFTIIGVAAQGFIGTEPDAPQFWTPLMMRDQLVGGWNQHTWLTERKANSFVLTGRLKPGVTQAQAEAELNVIHEQLARDYADPEYNKASIAVRSGATFLQLEGFAELLIAPLLTAVGLVLLIACVNVTNMLLARAAGRQREIAVRLALGASRLRVVRQLLTESVLLGALGGTAGLLLAAWAMRLIYSLALAQAPLPPAMIEGFALDLSPDTRVFGFAFLISLIAGIAAGLAPALQSSRPNLSGALKDEGSTFGAQFSQSRLRNALVVTQIAVCLTLLIAAGLLTRNLQKLQHLDTGFVTQNVFTLTVHERSQHPEPNRVNEFYRQLATRLQTLPGVKSVSQAQRQPWEGGMNTAPITIAGQSSPNGRPVPANFNQVSANYFQTFGLRITRGRGFTAQEEQSRAPVVVISESTARRFWPNENPLGKYIGIGVMAQRNDSNFPQSEIIGLTNDTRQGLIWQRDETFLYLPLPPAQPNTATAGAYLIVGTAGDPRAVMKAAHDEAALLDPRLTVWLRLVNDSLAVQMMPFQSVALLAGVLGALALLLASIGLYGVMSFVVSQRTREIGIRMALGASARDVIRLFLRQGGKLIVIGVAIGLAGGAAISTLLAVVLVDISQFDPAAFGVVAVFLTVIALSACYLPARRATKVDPMIALRHD
jgi:predicted permease